MQEAGEALSRSLSKRWDVARWVSPLIGASSATYVTKACQGAVDRRCDPSKCATGRVYQLQWATSAMFGVTTKVMLPIGVIYSQTKPGALSSHLISFLLKGKSMSSSRQSHLPGYLIHDFLGFSSCSRLKVISFCLIGPSNHNPNQFRVLGADFAS